MDNDVQDLRYLFPSDTKIIHFTGTPDKYTALLRSRCKSKDEFRQNWLKQYEKISRVAMRVLLTRPKTGKTVVYKAAFRCQHNTYPASHQRVKVPHKKHTGCPAILKVTIKASPENRRVRSIDKLRREYPTIISIIHDHNHQLPNQAILIKDYSINCEKVKEKCQEFKCDTAASPWIENKHKEGGNYEVEEPKWNFLKQCWNSLMEKWESSESVHLYKALLRATNCLENCKTVNATIAALNSVGKQLNKRKCHSKILIQPGAVQNTNVHCSESLISKMEVSSPVDELLVIDQGWII